MKRVISIQIHPKRIPQVNTEKIINSFYRIAKNSNEIQAIKIEANLIRPQYINVNYKTSDAKKTWKKIQEKILDVKNIGALIKLGSIILCEGDKSWKNYILLHHYNAKQKIDTL